MLQVATQPLLGAAPHPLPEAHTQDIDVVKPTFQPRALRSLFIFGLALVACVVGGFKIAQGDGNEPQVFRSADHAQPILYQISTRPWLYSLAQSGIVANCGQYVCLRDVPREEWERLKDDFCVDIVWLMGIWELGEWGLRYDQRDSVIQQQNFKQDLPDFQLDDVIGSPYAVKNYTVNLDIGNEVDLAGVRKLLHELGMKLMLDFVPNHFAVDSVWAKSKPSMFVQKPPNGQWPSDWWIESDNFEFAYGWRAWTDVIQINYWNSETVAIMTDILLRIASQADAIRCDVAFLLLNDVIFSSWGKVMEANGFSRPAHEFWKSSITKMREHYPDTLLMGEVYDQADKLALLYFGFDYVYDRRPLTILKESISNSYNLDHLRGYLGDNTEEFLKHTAHFVENHDEPRAAFTLGGQQQAFVGAVAVSTIPGLRFFYFGQFEGFSAKLDVQLRRATKQAPNTALRQQYVRLTHVLKRSVFHSGTWALIDTRTLCAWRWSSSTGKVLIVINFSDAAAWTLVQVSDVVASGAAFVMTEELLTGVQSRQHVNTMREVGMNCSLAPWTAQIIAYP